MGRRLRCLLNASLLSAMIPGDGCRAQVDSTINEPAPLISLSQKAEWLSMRSPHERYLLLEIHESPTSSQRTAGVQSAQTRHSRFISSIEGAWKKGFVERGVEGSTQALIQCQKEQSPALTTPFMRSDSQQAHCFRF